MDETRIASLERQCRRLVLGLAAAVVFSLAIAIATGWLFLREPSERESSLAELRTQRLVIVDPNGNAIGTFGLDENGGFLQVGGGEALVTILAGKAGTVVAQHGRHMSYMSADRDVCLFKVSSPMMEAAVKSTISAEESAFWVSSRGKGRVYMGLNRDYGSSAFLRTDEGNDVWQAAESKPKSP